MLEPSSWFLAIFGVIPKVLKSTGTYYETLYLLKRKKLVWNIWWIQWNVKAKKSTYVDVDTLRYDTMNLWNTNHIFFKNTVFLKTSKLNALHIDYFI